MEASEQEVKTTIDDIPSDLVGLVLDYIESSKVVPFATATPTLIWKTAQTVAPWEQGGCFAYHRWDAAAYAEGLLLRARDEFIDSVAEHTEKRWGFIYRPIRSMTCEDVRAVASLRNVTSLMLDKSLLSDSGLSKLLGSLKLLAALDIMNCDSLTGPGLIAALSQTPKLESLRLWEMKNVDDAQLAAALAPLTTIRTLYLCDFPLGEATSTQVFAKATLTSLELRTCGALDRGAWQRLPALTRLETLGIHNCSNIAALRGLDLSPMQSLHTVSIDYTDVDEGIFVPLGSLPSLAQLDLQASKRMESAHLRHLAKYPKLTSLNLNSVEGLDVRAGPYLAELQKLVTLLVRYTHVGDETVRYISTLPCLETLELGNYADLSDEAARHLTTAPCLKKLDWYCPTRVTDESCRLLSTIPTLTDVAYSCAKITNAGVAFLGTMPLLKSLRLYSCEEVTDEGFCWVFAKPHPALETVDVTNCAKMSKRVIKQLQNIRSIPR